MGRFIIILFTILTTSENLETYICSGSDETYNCELISEKPKEEKEYNIETTSEENKDDKLLDELSRIYF